MNYNEINKEKAEKEEEGASLVTASIMAAQNKEKSTNDAYNNLNNNALYAGSIKQGNDISPSFQVTNVPEANAAPGGGPMTFEPGSLA